MNERFFITQQSHPVAESVPLRKRDPDKTRVAIDNLKAFQKIHSGDDSSVRI